VSAGRMRHARAGKGIREVSKIRVTRVSVSVSVSNSNTSS